MNDWPPKGAGSAEKIPHQFQLFVFFTPARG